MAMFDLDDMSFIDANVAARALVGLDDDAALPDKLGGFVVGAEADESAASLRLLADGAIRAFEAHRHLRCADGTLIPVHCWVQSLDSLRANTALAVFAPRAGGAPVSFPGDVSGTRLRFSGPVVVGSLDLDMRVRRLGNDIVDL